MTTQQLFLFRPEPGRLDQFIDVLRQDRQWQESHGVQRAWASMLIHAGPANGVVGYFLDTEDSQSAGKALDEASSAWADGDPSPLVRVLNAGGPPAVIETSSMRVEITPNEPGVPEPPPPRIGFTMNVHPAPGAHEALHQVLAEHQAFVEGIGGHLRIYTTAAGPTSGDISLTAYTATWEDMGRIGDRTRSEGPAPLTAALQGANPPGVLAGTASTLGIDIS